MRRSHGQHNKIVCDKLHLQTEITCNDWVITTAFYSAIHFIDHLLFPLEYSDGLKFNNIGQAHSFIKANSIHQSRGILVGKFLNQIHDQYNFLIKECHHARYSNYDINTFLSDRAVRELDKIISVCNVNKKVAK
jgi:hypothetical protein